MRRLAQLSFVGFLLLGVGLGIGFFLQPTFQAEEGNPRTASETLRDAYRTVTQHYADPVDAQSVADQAIVGMLSSLDPHSVFIGAERMQAVRESFNASFEGVGITYELIPGPNAQDTMAVVTVLDDGPSARAGLQTGDRIVSIDGQSAIGYTHDRVQSTIKGPRGSVVEVGVRRPGVPDTRYVQIARGAVPLRTVDAAFMLSDQTGFIRLNRFAQTTYQEFVNALRRLDGEGMERLLLDLRGNQGGYMDMAVRVADEFLGGGQLIVEARSRHSEFSSAEYATDGGAYEQRPLIVLVDDGSASASEILAGALQDHDRALIVGRRTFGKGLVQKQYRLPDGSALRLTISRFYTPSGRLVQTPYRTGQPGDYYHAKLGARARDQGRTREEIVTRVPDSLRYRTDGGRTVIGGGGIVPDRIMMPDSASALFRSRVVPPSLLNDFARTWLDQHGATLQKQWTKAAFLEAFEVGAPLFDAFLTFAAQYPRTTSAPTQVLHNVQGKRRETVEALLRAHLARRLFGEAAWYPAYAQIDRVVNHALGEWDDAVALAAR